MNQRSAGVLLPITALPSPYGVGTLGREAFRFVDFLKQAGQTVWQILPIGPTGYGDSPYQPFSAFAGNPYWIDLPLLVEQGLLTEEECTAADWGERADRVDYGSLFIHRLAVLRMAYRRFLQQAQRQQPWEEFRRAHAYWLKPYALFMAAKGLFHSTAWYAWPSDALRRYEPKGIQIYSELLEDDIRFYEFVQYLFFTQFFQLKRYANQNGVRLVGDMPLYVALDSCDVWSNPEVFWLDEDGKPVCVAGCPPDYFSQSGQLWGNPLYNWEALQQNRYRWWMQRIRHARLLFDAIRIDHFRGFESFYAIPFGDKDATGGTFLQGPGMDFFQALTEQLGPVPIIAENLGEITKAVDDLLEETGYPGMKVLQFAFSGGKDNVHLPHNYPQNCVVYTGTHDNDTLAGWLRSRSAKERFFIRRYCKLGRNEDACLGIIRTALQSKAQLAVVPMQDWLELPSSERMNTPSSPSGNWQWRLLPGALDASLAQTMRRMTEQARRLASTTSGEMQPSNTL